MTEYITGKDICSRYNDIENDAFGTDEHKFILTDVDKESLYDAPCSFSTNGKNLMTFEEWEKHPENYDDYHTDNVKQMIDHIHEGGSFPPLICNKDFGLYDGQHRLTAYSMMPEINKVQIYKEI